MTILTLLREALASAWAARIPSLLIAVVSAAMCFVALMTVGQTAANQAAVGASLEGAGARTLIVRDAAIPHGFINHRTLTAIASVSSVETAIGLGRPFDSVNGRLGAGAPLLTTWPVHGDMASVVTLVRGRWPQPGEAVISEAGQRRLGLTEPVGYLAAGTDQYPIVGQFIARDGFDDLGAGAVTNANNVPTASELRVVIRSIASAAATQTVVLSILRPGDPTTISIQSPLGMAELSQLVGAQLAGFGRSLLLLILAVGGLFVAAVVLSDVLIRRRDLGRRRTLGATRVDLTALVTARAALSAGIGAFLGSASTLVAAAHDAYPPPVDFAAAVSLLATITAGIAAIAPAAYAANRDPVSVMRTP